MDANGLSYWSWSRPEDSAPLGPAAAWEAAGLALRSIRAAAPPSLATTDARRAAADGPATAVDAFGAWARVVADGRGVLAGGAAEPETTIFDATTTAPGAGEPLLPADGTIRDIAWTPDGALLVAAAPAAGDGVLIWLDLLDRFDPVTLREPGFAPDRVAVSGNGMVWVVDRASRLARRLRGRPLPGPVARLERAAHVFGPRPENPDPPRLEAPFPGALPDDGGLIDVAADDQGRLIALASPAGGDAVVRLVDQRGAHAATTLRGAPGPFAIGWRPSGGVALLFPHHGEALAYPAPGLGGGALDPTGERLPLRGWTGGRLCNGGAGLALRYPTEPRGRRGAVSRVAPLAALSAPSFARRGEAALAPVDSGADGFVWHRLYVEAVLPPDCAATLWIGAGDDRETLAALPRSALHPHRFGAGGEAGLRGVWLDRDSEKPFVASALGCARRPGVAGLFTCLLQRGDGAVPSRIAGRFLRIEVALEGNGRATPRIAAIRAWGPRFSYRDRYLPGLFTVEEGPLAAGSDFLDRFLGLFESVLTPMEDDVATSWRMTTPGAAPREALDWLAGWIGAEADTALTEAQTRRLIANAVDIWRWRGTLRGLERMLDVATDDGVGGGEIVVVEHFRLRRTFATILGADLSQPFDPLTRGTAASANSHLGPGFFLGAEDRRRLFALFRPSLLDDPLSTAEERIEAFAELADFLDRDAFHVTVLLHGPADAERRGLVRRIVERETPAHVVARVREAPASLIAGLAALLAVDTYMGPPPSLPGFTVGGRLGQASLRDTPSLDPRNDGAP